ncbi:MAG: RluA family pseudouridine synthase [Rhizobiaceae bacterium]|nr:RluA family pseudouridine synthase [Rhizobiaceae bacterium]
MDDIITVGIASGGAPQRLDQALAAALAGTLSRSRIQALIEGGDVSVDGEVVRQCRHAVRGGETVRIRVPEAAPAVPKGEAIPFDILHEDDDLIVLMKPAGLTVHPGAGVPDGTLVNALIAHCGDSLSGIGGVKRPGIVHRLDKETSGVMVVAKNDMAHHALSAQFADHGRTGLLERRYLALVWGAPARSSGTVDAPLGRSSTDRTKRAVVALSHPDAREAVTHYVIRERFGPPAKPWASLVECRLETGRTHQIRVHMAHLGHPLIGDPLYGKGFQTRIATLPEPVKALALAFKRQSLHAAHLTFAHPRSKKVMVFDTPPPADMASLIAAFAEAT